MNGMMKKHVWTWASCAVLAGALSGAASAGAQEAKSAASWAESVKIKGDIRARAETIDVDGSQGRERARIRARLAAEAKVNDDVDAGIGLASGGNDPVSSNQTLGEGFSRKDIGLDLAYIDLHPEAVPGGNLVLGKMKMPFVAVNDLQWDSDLNPEGVAAKIELPASDALKALLNTGAFWVEERSKADETMLYGLQAALEGKVEDVKLTGGASFYLYDNVKGFAPVVDAEDSFGNSVATSEEDELSYLNDYEILEAFAKLGFTLGLPVEFAGNYVVNQEADADDTGYMAGITVGKLKDAGSYNFFYNYRKLEADAVLGAYADSDTWGGGTDGKGHKFGAGYQISKNLSGHVTYMISEQGLDNGKDYDRLQVDLVAKF